MASLKKIIFMLFLGILSISTIIFIREHVIANKNKAQSTKEYKHIFYNPLISVNYGELYNNTLKFSIKNTGNVPLRTNKFYIITENGERINISDKQIIFPNKTITITMKLSPQNPIMCYNYSTILIIKSDYYMVEDIMPVYCG